MLYRDKETSKQIAMADFLDMLRNFSNFTGNIERDIRQSIKRVKAPEEIDIYNFFEQWGGCAECKMYSNSMTIYSIEDYVRFYDAINIRYHIGKAKYYALRFNGRGVFLVSEKRYNELKEKKGK